MYYISIIILYIILYIIVLCNRDSRRLETLSHIYLLLYKFYILFYKCNLERFQTSENLVQVEKISGYNSRPDSAKSKETVYVSGICPFEKRIPNAIDLKHIVFVQSIVNRYVQPVTRPSVSGLKSRRAFRTRRRQTPRARRRRRRRRSSSGRQSSPLSTTSTRDWSRTR